MVNECRNNPFLDGPLGRLTSTIDTEEPEDEKKHGGEKIPKLWSKTFHDTGTGRWHGEPAHRFDTRESLRLAMQSQFVPQSLSQIIVRNVPIQLDTIYSESWDALYAIYACQLLKFHYWKAE